MSKKGFLLSAVAIVDHAEPNLPSFITAMYEVTWLDACGCWYPTLQDLNRHFFQSDKRTVFQKNNENTVKSEKGRWADAIVYALLHKPMLIICIAKFGIDFDKKMALLSPFEECMEHIWWHGFTPTENGKAPAESVKSVSVLVEGDWVPCSLLFALPPNQSIKSKWLKRVVVTPPASLGNMHSLYSLFTADCLQSTKKGGEDGFQATNRSFTVKKNDEQKNPTDTSICEFEISARERRYRWHLARLSECLDQIPSTSAKVTKKY